MSRAGLTLLYAGHRYFEDLALPGWAPQPDWQLGFAAAAAELTHNHWIDDLKVDAAVLLEHTILTTYVYGYYILTMDRTTSRCACAPPSFPLMLLWL